MPLLEIILWIVAVVVGIAFLLFMAAGFLIFLGAMSIPEDLHDDVLGDRK